jgi:hypothetical protein
VDRSILRGLNARLEFAYPLLGRFDRVLNATTTIVIINVAATPKLIEDRFQLVDAFVVG